MNPGRPWLAVLPLLLLAATVHASQGPLVRNTCCAEANPPRHPDSTPVDTRNGAAAATTRSEWMTGAGLGFGIDMLQSRGDSRYLAPSVSWGYTLTDAAGPGWLRGRFAWAVEAVPLFAQFEPARVRGVGISPLVWRWNFVGTDRVEPFAELAVGGLWTDHAIPAGTTRANFVAHGGLGLRRRIAARVALVAAYRFQHLSNGNQLPRNPGVNAHLLWLGLSVR